MSTDEKIGRYKIIEKIGTGGMGEVFLAKDDKLGRTIALKTLPNDVANNPDRMRRFISEAKTASALNHPNIITIYEINDEGDRPFIAMEYVKGDTLTKLAKKRPVDHAKALDVTVQVAEALSAAHEANIVHRDVKPDNIIIRPDGLVKVLDFGLAKLTENDGSSDPEAETIAHRTNPGMIIGTASYMSPEQARGKEVDGRSDIFSLGTLMYQMFAGRLPFTGENYVDVIGAILHKEPPPIREFAPDLPHEIDVLIKKCLRKDRKERYQSVRELLADIRDLRVELGLASGSGSISAQRFFGTTDSGRMRATGEESIEGVSTAGHSRFGTSSISQLISDEFRLHPVRMMLTFGAIAAVLIVGGFGVTRYVGSPSAEEAFQRMKFSKVTTSGTVISDKVAISPDGRYVVYVAYEDGKESLWVKQTETQSVVRTVPPSSDIYRAISFSRDGNYVYYVASEQGGTGAIYEMPLLGGAARRLSRQITGPIGIAPDGKRISFIRNETELMISEADGEEPVKLAESKKGDRWMISAWSPDGTKVMGGVFSAEDSKYHLIEIDATTGEQKPGPGQPWLALSGLAWLPEGDALLIAGREPEVQYSQIWLMSYPDGKLRRVTNDLNNYLGLSISADGSVIASVQQYRLTNIWVTQPGQPSAAVRKTVDVGRDEGMSGVSFVPDGRVVYSVRERGVQDLWITGSTPSESRQLTFNAGTNFSPFVTPDGKTIVFISTREGAPNIWRMDMNGENAVQITRHEGVAANPQVTPDGEWIVYELTDVNNDTAIWKISINGGEPEKLTTVESARATLTTDGKFFACLWEEGKKNEDSRLAIVPITGGQPKEVLDLPHVLRSRNYRWSNDDSALIYVAREGLVDNLWMQPITGGNPRRLTDFTSERIYRFDILRSDGTIAMSRGSETSDVVMITDFR